MDKMLNKLREIFWGTVKKYNKLDFCTWINKAQVQINLLLRYLREWLKWNQHTSGYIHIVENPNWSKSEKARISRPMESTAISNNTWAMISWTYR